MYKYENNIVRGFDKYKKESVNNSIFYRYANVLNQQIEKGKVVASVNFAKPDYYYDSRLDEIFGGKIITIDNRNKGVINWKLYDIILMPGGNQKLLKEGLLKTGFSINNLKSNVIMIGDSAGAYVMGKYFPAYDGEVENIEESDIKKYAEEGLYPNSNALVIAHINNKRYVPDSALELSKKLAKELNVEILALQENEEKLLDENGKFVNFRIEEIFSC